MEATVSGLIGRQRRRPPLSARQLRPGRWRPGSHAGVLHGLEAQLPAAPVSAGTARHLAGQLLTDCGLEALTDDVLLVTSELAANAITASQDSRRAGGSRGSSPTASPAADTASTAAIALRLARTPDGVLVAVADPAAADRLPWLLRLAPLGPVPLAGDAGDLEDLTERGRGLMIAAAVADRLGWYRAGKWTVVWAEFLISQDGAEADDVADARDRDAAGAHAADAQHRAGTAAYAA
jgi:anti-sigma regulatory factor (Ser/Thr protein kinase)